MNSPSILCTISVAFAVTVLAAAPRSFAGPLTPVDIGFSCGAGAYLNGNDTSTPKNCKGGPTKIATNWIEQGVCRHTGYCRCSGKRVGLGSARRRRANSRYKDRDQLWLSEYRRDLCPGDWWRRFPVRQCCN